MKQLETLFQQKSDQFNAEITRLNLQINEQMTKIKELANEKHILPNRKQKSNKFQ
jgi:hypothetical protein